MQGSKNRDKNIKISIHAGKTKTFNNNINDAYS